MSPFNPVKSFLALCLLLVPLAGCGSGGAVPASPAAVAPEAAGTTTAAEPAAAPAPPVAKRVPHRLEAHGHVRIDPHYWLRDREDPEVIAYLEAENAYTDSMTAHTEELQEELFEEIVARIPQEDESPPYRLDDYWYYSRFEEGAEYPIHARKEGSLDAPEEVLLDEPELAEGHEFFSVRGPSVSLDHAKLAYGVDTVGRRKYTLRFKDLATGETLPDEIQEVTGNVAWAADGRTVFYT